MTLRPSSPGSLAAYIVPVLRVFASLPMCTGAAPQHCALLAGATDDNTLKTASNTAAIRMRRPRPPGRPPGRAATNTVNIGNIAASMLQLVCSGRVCVCVCVYGSAARVTSPESTVHSDLFFFPPNFFPPKRSDGAPPSHRAPGRDVEVGAAGRGACVRARLRTCVRARTCVCATVCASGRCAAPSPGDGSMTGRWRRVRAAAGPPSQRSAGPRRGAAAPP